MAHTWRAVLLGVGGGGLDDPDPSGPGGAEDHVGAAVVHRLRQRASGLDVTEAVVPERDVALRSPAPQGPRRAPRLVAGAEAFHPRALEAADEADRAGLRRGRCGGPCQEGGFVVGEDDRRRAATGVST